MLIKVLKGSIEKVDCDHRYKKGDPYFVKVFCGSLMETCCNACGEKLLPITILVRQVEKTEEL